MPAIFGRVRKQSYRNRDDSPCEFKSDDAISRSLPIRPRRWNRERETRMEIELRSSSFGHRSCFARARFDHKAVRIISDAVSRE